MTEKRKGAKTDAQIEREEILYNKKIRRWQAQVEASFKEVKLPGGKVLHLIKKADLQQEGPGDKKKEMSMGSIRSQTMRARKYAGDDEYYSSNDDRSWSGMSNKSLTKDEDFIDEEEDPRTVWEIMRGAEKDLTDSGDHHDTSEDGSSLNSNEINCKEEYSGTDDDFVNDYWTADRTGLKQDTVLLGGKIKIKKGIKEKKKLAKQVRSMQEMADKRNERRKQRFQMHAGGGAMAKRKIKRGDDKVTAGKPDVPEDESISIDLSADDEGDDSAGDVEMTAMQRRRSASMKSLLADGEHAHALDNLDPFEIEQINAKKRKEERRRKRRERKRLEREEKKDDEALDELWGHTEDMPTASKLDSVGRVAATYLSTEESSDDDAAQRELADGGAKVISQSVALTMEAVLDMAFGGDDESDEEDSMAGELCHVVIEDE